MNIVNIWYRLYLQQMLFLGNCILNFTKYMRNIWNRVKSFTEPYVYRMYDYLGIYYPRPTIGTESWHLFVTMRHIEVGEIPVSNRFENALNENLPEKTNSLICKYGDIPITTDINIDDIIVEIMNGDGIVSEFRGDDIINRF
jgi:hypothetical protein